MDQDDHASRPPCLAPASYFTPPSNALPPDACDCHAHILGPFDRFPLVSDRSYTPPPSPPEAYFAMLRALGLKRGVLVQPSVYGTDNQRMLNVLERHGESLRGIAVVDPDTPVGELQRIDRLGVRGFRINLLFRGGVGLQALEILAEKVAPLGWHAQALFDIRELPALVSRIERLPVPVVFDHMGHFPAHLGVNWDGFQALLALAAAGRAWVKISGAYRLSSHHPDHPDVRPIALKLVEAIPDRLVWGSDWPHVALHEHMPNTGDLLNEFLAWCPDRQTQERILTTNAARLYGF